MKISNKFFFLILFSIFILIPISSFSPHVSASGNLTYISATDILKNFKFESIGGEPIVNEGAFNDKLRFDTQMAWLLYQNDINILSREEIGDSTVLKYSLILRNKINIFTNVRLDQMAYNLLPRTEEFIGCYYRHNRLGGSIDYQWEGIIKWDCWDFGDIYNYNFQNNHFTGRVVMSFDIDANPIPDVFGEYTEKEYDYIAVSEAGIVTNTWGKMTDQMPTIIVLSPSEYESEWKDDETYTSGSAESNYFEAIIDPNENLYVYPDPIQTFDARIVPDTAGSSMNPKNKDGTPLWDPEIEEKSMTGCNIYYDLNSLSPVVYRYGGRLSWTQHDLETEDYLIPFKGIVPKTNHYYFHDYVENRDVALHGINRYIQVDMIVKFEVWTSVKLGTLTDAYENLRLSFPEEYYDELVWSTLAGGWKGSTIKEYGLDPFEAVTEWFDDLGAWFADFFGNMGDIVMWIIIIAGIGIGVYIFFVIRRKQIVRR